MCHPPCRSRRWSHSRPNNKSPREFQALPAKSMPERPRGRTCVEGETQFSLLEGAVVIFQKDKNVMCLTLLKPNSEFGNLAIWPVFGCWDLTTNWNTCQRARSFTYEIYTILLKKMGCLAQRLLSSVQRLLPNKVGIRLRELRREDWRAVAVRLSRLTCQAVVAQREG